MIELSSDQHNSMKENFIHLSDVALDICDGNEVQWFSKFKIYIYIYVNKFYISQLTSILAQKAQI